MQFVSDLSATALVTFMESIHTNGPVGGPLTVDKLSSYMIFVYKIGEMLRPVEFDVMALDMETIHQCAVKCGALKEKDTEGMTNMDAILYNAHMGTFFQRLAGFIANGVKNLPQ